MDSNERRSENLESEIDGQYPSDSVTFIDVLFAVVMSLGLAKIMTRPWFKPEPEGAAPAIAFEILVILIGYLTLLLSWWGYHRSIRRRRIPSGAIGQAIFAVDILILVGYWLLLVMFESFLFVLCVLLAIYLMYVIWDFLWWRKQRPEKDPKQWRRRAVTILWTALLGAIFVTYLLLSLCGSPPAPVDWIFVVLAHLVNILYRIHKEHLFPGLLLDMLVFKLRHKEVR
jgi:amino acid transporter